jgi:hypothetical protein
VQVEEEVETVAEGPLALSEAAVAIEVAISVGEEVAAVAVAVMDLLIFESFGMYLVILSYLHCVDD